MKKTYNVQITGKSNCHATQTEDFAVSAYNLKEAKKLASRNKSIKGRVTHVSLVKNAD